MGQTSPLPSPSQRPNNSNFFVFIMSVLFHFCILSEQQHWHHGRLNGGRWTHASITKRSLSIQQNTNRRRMRWKFDINIWDTGFPMATRPITITLSFLFQKNSSSSGDSSQNTWHSSDRLSLLGWLEDLVWQDLIQEVRHHVCIATDGGAGSKRKRMTKTKPGANNVCK